MICEAFQAPDGTTGTVCFEGRRERCACGKPATLLCDGPAPAISRRTRCDAPICTGCATKVGPSLDLCPRCQEDAVRRRGGQPQPVSALLPFGPGHIDDAAEALLRARAHAYPDQQPLPERAQDAPPPEGIGSLQRPAGQEERHDTGAGKAGPPPQPDAGESPPPPASAAVPEDFVSEPDLEPPIPANVPKVCECGATIYWAQVLDRHLQRIKNDDTGRWRSIPVESVPCFEGRIQLLRRPGEGIVCREFGRGEAVPAGAILRKRHECPNHPRRGDRHG